MDKNGLFHKCVAFITAVHQVTHDLTRDIRPDEITPAQYKILEYIAVSQPVTLSEISECMHMSMPNTSRELRKLGEKRLCEKVHDNEDRRKQFIRLSEQGEAMMNGAFHRIESRFVQHIGAVSDEELEEIERALDLLRTKVFY